MRYCSAAIISKNTELSARIEDRTGELRVCVSCWRPLAIAELWAEKCFFGEDVYILRKKSKPVQEICQ